MRQRIATVLCFTAAAAPIAGMVLAAMIGGEDTGSDFGDSMAGFVGFLAFFASVILALLLLLVAWLVRRSAPHEGRPVQAPHGGPPPPRIL